ncbi:MAG: hypothetical protein HC873_06670 [Leptolyngbyaceae cyanobacterium SL_1_1]|nr:hypothetical protein [Leptolyngbyaceae cyanobacterium SL_1_1]
MYSQITSAAVGTHSQAVYVCQTGKSAQPPIQIGYSVGHDTGSLAPAPAASASNSPNPDLVVYIQGELQSEQTVRPSQAAKIAHRIAVEVERICERVAAFKPLVRWLAGSDLWLSTGSANV